MQRMKYGGCLEAVNSDPNSTRVADSYFMVLLDGRMDRDLHHGWVFYK